MDGRWLLADLLRLFKLSITPDRLIQFFLLAAARKVRDRLVLRLLLPFLRLYIYMCIRTYHVRNNYVRYIVAMRPYFSRLQQFRQLLCVAAMSSLPQLRLRDGYREAEAT